VASIWLLHGLAKARLFRDVTERQQRRLVPVQFLFFPANGRFFAF
jgi:hypothetical protein